MPEDNSEPSRLRHAVADLVQAAAAPFGYKLTNVSSAGACELTLEKNGATFVLWLRPASEDTPAFHQTARFKVGYRRNPPDPQGYEVLRAACEQIEAWERALSPDAAAQLCGTGASAPSTSIDPAPPDAATAALLAGARYESIYADWLPVRDRQWEDRCRSLQVADAKRVLLVNATKGLQFYPSVVDFFATLQRVQPQLQVTCASYFDEIFQFHEGVVEKGLRVAPVAELASWPSRALNQFDVILCIGPSDVALRFMTLPDLQAKLVLLDLAFYHQLIDSTPRDPAQTIRVGNIRRDKTAQLNKVVVYSCQPPDKVADDLAGVCNLELLQWRWFNYIPIGFRYVEYYRSDARRFDVALLGRSGRDYGLIDAQLFRGCRFLFLGDAHNLPAIERLQREADVSVVSRVDENTYARLLSLCRCVIVPLTAQARNTILSVNDALASGKALLTPRHPGISRLEADGVPAVLFDAAGPTQRAADELFASFAAVSRHAGEIESRAIAFAKEKLDIYHIVWRIVTEQVI